jgi:hypothetical protein
VGVVFVDEANLSNVMKWLVRASIPIAAILVPSAFFLSVLSPDDQFTLELSQATKPGQHQPNVSAREGKGIESVSPGSGRNKGPAEAGPEENPSGAFMRMAGIHPLNPPPIQSQNPPLRSFGPVCGTSHYC